MAKFLEITAFFLLVSGVLIAEARRIDPDCDDEEETAVVKSKLFRKRKDDNAVEVKVKGGELGILGDGKVSDLDFDNIEHELEAAADKPKTKPKKHEITEDEFKNFLNKFRLLFRAYASKQLLPELKSMIIKIADFTLEYLAKEKPEEMNKFNELFQESAKRTDKIVHSC